MNSSYGLLLDTHAWIWLMLGDKSLSQELVEQIELSAQQSLLYLSAISVWELAMLVSKGRVQLKQDVLQWTKSALNVPGLQCIPLSPEIMIESSRLPGECHGDPADRMIIATARHLGASLLTRDEKIQAYAASGYLHVLP